MTKGSTNKPEPNSKRMHTLGTTYVRTFLMIKKIKIPSNERFHLTHSSTWRLSATKRIIIVIITIIIKITKNNKVIL